MKVIYSNFIPLKGFHAINLFGIVFVRKDGPKLDQRILNHESIHTRQMLELLIVGFYIWYIIEWIVRCLQYKNSYEGYRNICFEREAFSHDTNFSYLENRKPFSFVKSLFNK